MATTSNLGRGLDEQAGQLADLDTLAKSFGQSLTGALGAGTASGKELTGVLGDVANALTASLGRTASSALQSTLSGGLQSAAQALGAAAVTSSFGGDITPFAKGGVVASPTYFPTGSGLGLMGEAGAEAVLPLARGADGTLGVASAGGSATNVNVTVHASDLDSFKRSEAQVSAMLARAVARGKRAL